MSQTEPGGRGTGEEHDRRDDDPQGEPDLGTGEPDIGTAGAFPALANDALPQDPDVPTDVDPGDPRRPADGGELDDEGGSRSDGPSGTDD
jgi:hypothetical protein